MAGITGIQYREVDGIQYPVLEGTMSEETVMATLGKYGRMAARDLQENDPDRYGMMLLSGMLLPKMQEVQEPGGNAARRDRGETGTGMDGTGQRESIRYHENDGPADTGRDGSRGRSDQGSHSSDEITKTQQPEDMPQEKPKQEEQKQEEGTALAVPLLCLISSRGKSRKK